MSSDRNSGKSRCSSRSIDRNSDGRKRGAFAQAAGAAAAERSQGLLRISDERFNRGQAVAARQGLAAEKSQVAARQELAAEKSPVDDCQNCKLLKENLNAQNMEVCSLKRQVLDRDAMVKHLEACLASEGRAELPRKKQKRTEAAAAAKAKPVFIPGESSNSSEASLKEARRKFDARCKVYEDKYRFYVQLGEGKAHDKAMTEMRLENLWINESFTVGEVPGSYVGFRCRFRNLLLVLGLHRHPRQGIQFYTNENSKRVACSIVAGGPTNKYRDKMNSDGSVDYIGQGDPEGKFEQDMRDGNEALANSMLLGAPVRMTMYHDRKEDKHYKYYEYHGLYTVVGVSRMQELHGRVFKFTLRPCEKQQPRARQQQQQDDF